MKPRPCSDPACGKPAVSRCDVCSPDGELFFCGDAACFDKAHNVFIAEKHRKTLVPWNSRTRWKARCCAAHPSKPLEYWCDACAVPVCFLCYSHGTHKGHATSLVSDVWPSLQQDLQEKAGQLDAEIERDTARLEQLAALQGEAAMHEGSVGDAARALDEVEELFAGKMRALREQVAAAAGSQQARAGEKHAAVASRIASVRTLVESMRATCTDGEDNAQRVAVEYEEHRRQEEALPAPVPSLVDCKVAVPSDALAALQKAVTDLAVVSDGVAACALCKQDAPASSVAACSGCKQTLCETCLPCILCAVKRELALLSKAGQAEVDIPDSTLPYDKYVTGIATAYNIIGEVWSHKDKNEAALRLHHVALELLEAKAPIPLALATTYHSIGCALQHLNRNSKALEWYRKALVIREVEDSESFDIAVTYSNMAMIFKHQGKNFQSLQSYRKTLAIRTVMKPDDAKMAATYAAVKHVTERDVASSPPSLSLPPKPFY